MKQSDAAAKVANLIQHMETLLQEKDMCYARQTIERRHRDIFDIIFDAQEEGMLEQRIAAYVHDKLLFFEVAVPVTCADDDVVAALVNDLNCTYPVGTFQFDIRDGELNWTHYLAARNGVWPGDDMVLSVLASAREMAGVLYRALLAASDAPKNEEQ